MRLGAALQTVLAHHYAMHRLSPHHLNLMTWKNEVRLCHGTFNITESRQLQAPARFTRGNGMIMG